VIGPVHRSVRERWLADAHGYRNKSKALAQLLASVDGGWSKIPVMRQVVALRRLSGYSLSRLFFSHGLPGMHCSITGARRFCCLHFEASSKMVRVRINVI